MKLKKENNWNPTGGDTGPTPLPIGTGKVLQKVGPDKPIIKPDEKKKKVLLKKLKKVIRDEVRKQLLYDIDKCK